MAVLRSGAETSKSPKCPSSASSSPAPSTVQQPSTPAKACEDSHSPAMADSNLSSPSESQTPPPHLGPGFFSPGDDSASAPRRSARIAFRLKGPDSAPVDDRSESRRMAVGSGGGRGAEGRVGSRRGRRRTRGGRGGRDVGGGAMGGDEAVVDVVSEDGNGVDSNAVVEVSSGSDSGSVGGGNETGCVTRVLDVEGGNAGGSGNRKLVEGVLETTRKRRGDLVEEGVQMNLNFVGLGSGEEICAASGSLDGMGLREKEKERQRNEKQMDESSSYSALRSSRRKSRRLMEKFEGGLISDVLLDLNSVPEDEGERMPASKEAELGCNQDQATKNGELAISPGLRSLRSSAWVGGSIQGELCSNLNLDLTLNSFVKDGSPSIDTVRSMTGAKRRYSKEEKQILVEDNTLAASSDAAKIDSEMDPTANGSLLTQSKKRYIKEDKGKGKLIEDDYLASGLHLATSYPVTDDALVNGVNLLEEVASAFVASKENEHIRKERGGRRKVAEIIDVSERKMEMDASERNKARFLDTAKAYAPKFAHFKPEDEENNSLSHSQEVEAPVIQNGPEGIDWPGPFATAMRIIEDRAAKLNARQGNSVSGKSESAPVISWTPSQGRVHKQVAPSLQDLCFNVLCENADAITSLEGIPDSLKSKLSWQLCDSRKMSCHILGLLATGSPSEIRLKDCSWITEDQLREILKTCKMDHLKVLQFDLCGRCLPDYIFCETIAQSPNNLPSLINISLRGAYQLSDNGLSALVSSAPLLQSMNLGQCSLVTHAGIINLAQKLDLRELYIDECQNVDAMLILPALKKLKHLDVLSVAGVPNVCNEFVWELLSVSGPNMKELVLADCGKLTDNSLKAIAASCPGLLSIDLSGLLKLTDSAMRHLANGCRSLTTLKLRQNAFSDEGIAAFLEASGASLRELSVNNVKEVSHNTAIALSAHCSNNLCSLDLSWCRKLTDEALGLIVDKCLALRLLKLFGCTQITNKFLDGHSNPLVEIVGLKAAPILTNLVAPDSLEVPLRYSLV